MQPRVLLLSQRKIADLVAFCLAYEFEDTFAAVSDAVRIDVTNLPSLEFRRRLYKLARLTSGSSGWAQRVVPSPSAAIHPQGDFDLFFPIFNNAYELYSLAMAPGWRQRCHKAACFITEIGTSALPEYLVELLSAFDHIFLGTRHGSEDVERLTGKTCSYLPLAADVLRFTPSPAQTRPIDVCNIGRRSTVTHQALLSRAGRQQSFYYYDTVAASGANRKDRTFRVDNPQDHRQMLATLLRHSSYFIANRGYINRPGFIPGSDEISARFYEGAAAGTVMIGEAPRSGEFKRQFDWTDAVIHLPFDSPEIDHILGELNSDPDRLRAARRANVREAALRHDWLYRIEAIFQTLGLAPGDLMLERGEKLKQIATRVQAGTCVA